MTQLSDPGQAVPTQVSYLGQQRGGRPKYPLSKAAEMAGVSLSTIKRKRAAGAFPNADQDEHGTWLVPVEDLLAAGYHLNGARSVTQVSPPTAQVNDPGQPDVTQGSDPGQDDPAGLRHQLELAEYRRRAEVAEAERDSARREVESARREVESERKRADELAYVIRHQLLPVPAAGPDPGRPDDLTADQPQPDTSAAAIPPPPTAVRRLTKWLHRR